MIIDLTNNDEHQNTHGFSSPDRVLNNICTIVDQCSHAGSLPIVVSFPRIPYLNSARPVHSQVMDLCRNLGIVTLDIYWLIEKMIRLQKYPLKHVDLFADEAHIKPMLARAVGGEVARILFEIHASGDVTTSTVDRSFKRNRYRGITSITDAEILLRETSITSQVVAVLLSDHNYNLDVGDDLSDIVAVHFNAMQSNAGLFLSGMRAMGASPESNGSKVKTLLSVIRPIMRPFGVQGLVPIEARDEGERTVGSRFELGGIVVQDQQHTKQICVAARPLGDFEIAERLSKDVLSNLTLIASNA